MEKTKLNKILNAVEDLPTLPLFATQLLSEINDEKSSAKSISNIMRHDQTITMKILKIVNSAYYGFNQKITTLNHAVAILGLESIRNIVLTLSVFETMRNVEGMFNREKFWGHSIGCAVVSQTVAEKARLNNVSGTAFVSGLIHDIGKVIEDAYLSDDFEMAVRYAASFGVPIYESEEKVIGYDHSYIGKQIAYKWNLPKIIVEPIVYHHNLPANMNELEVDGKLIAIVHIADIITKIKNFGSSGDNTVPELQKGMWEILGISQNDIEFVLNKADDRFEKAKILLDLAIE